ncbi:hypothetical protein ACFQ4K_15150 [Tistrella bauzanensis]
MMTATTTATALSATAAAQATPAAEPATACFFVVAAAEVGTMARVLEIFALRSLLPSRWHSQRVRGVAPTKSISTSSSTCWRPTRPRNWPAGCGSWSRSARCWCR